MDGLANRALLGFYQQQKFMSNQGRLSLIEILTVFGSKPGQPLTSQLPDPRIAPSRLLQHLDETRSLLDSCKDQYEGLIQLVVIKRAMNGVLLCGDDVFQDLYRKLQLDHFTLHMLGRESYGYQHVKGRKGDTYYVKTISSLIIWSYDETSRSTMGILIPRGSDSVHNTADDIVASFRNTMLLHKHLIKHSWFLRLVSLIEIMFWMDSVYDGVLERIRESEGRSGHGCWKSWEREAFGWNMKIEEIFNMSAPLSFSLSALANIARHAKLGEKIGDIQELIGCGKRDLDKELQDAREAVGLVLEQMRSRSLDVEYLQERARNQLPVIFSLINQKDVATSLQTASANLQIAAAAKEDSSSMKVVAMMTLLFLPGTFFAALFAIPSLQWTEQEVVSSRFWVYWAFTLPCTAVLMGLYVARNFVDYGFLKRRLLDLVAPGRPTE